LRRICLRGARRGRRKASELRLAALGALFGPRGDTRHAARLLREADGVEEAAGLCEVLAALERAGDRGLVLEAWEELNAGRLTVEDCLALLRDLERLRRDQPLVDE